MNTQTLRPEMVDGPSWLSSDEEAEGDEESDEKSVESGGDRRWNRRSFPGWNSDPEVLRIARRDAQASLDQTIASIQDIDETAMIIFRFDLLILGLILAAITSVPTTLELGNLVSVMGFCLIILSSIAALLTNIGSDYPTGISEDYLRELRSASWTELEWNEWMIREYESWLADAGEMASGDAKALFITQILLGLGFLCLLLGIVLGSTGMLDPLDPLKGAGDTSRDTLGVVFYVASPLSLT